MPNVYIQGLHSGSALLQHFAISRPPIHHLKVATMSYQRPKLSLLEYLDLRRVMACQGKELTSHPDYYSLTTCSMWRSLGCSQVPFQYSQHQFKFFKLCLICSKQKSKCGGNGTTTSVFPIKIAPLSSSTN